MSLRLSAAELQYTAHSLQHGVRLDGRGCHDFRPVELELDVIAQASGSSRLHLGATDVVVGVKVEVGTPAADSPSSGRLQVAVECSACASPDFEGRGGESWGLQLASALQASLLPGKGHGLDLTALNILSGKSVWILYVDALVLNDDGNVLGAISLAARAALAATRIPSVEVVMGEGGEEPELQLDDDPSASKLLDVSRVPLILSLAQVGKQHVVDCSAQEELCSSASLHVAVTAQGQLCGLSKDGGGSLDTAMLGAMMEAAQALGPPLTKQQDLYLQASLPARPGR